VPTTYIVREATAADIDTIVGFTARQAREAEGIDLGEAEVRRGVSAAFGDRPRATYWVAERAGTVVASISVVNEWNDSHGGDYWWIQSLFIVPQYRGSGLVELLLDHVARTARAAGRSMGGSTRTPRARVRFVPLAMWFHDRTVRRDDAARLTSREKTIAVRPRKALQSGGWSGRCWP
jgi:L-amino acid N-acyltransferase YncA